MSTHDVPLWLWPLMLLFVSIIFIFNISLFAEMSGWNRLAERYALPGALPEKTHRFQSIKLNRVLYRRVLQMAETPEGLYLAPMWFFRLNHQPLFIPWNAIHVEEQPTWWGFYPGYFQAAQKEIFYIPASVKRRWTPYLRRVSPAPLEPEVA